MFCYVHLQIPEANIEGGWIRIVADMANYVAYIRAIARNNLNNDRQRTLTRVSVMIYIKCFRQFYIQHLEVTRYN